jgi:transcriptional regulator with XRE-family HTH domain
VATMDLRQARKSRGFSIYRLAADSGVSHSTIIRIEQGHIPNPTAHTLSRLESALRLKPGSIAIGAGRWRNGRYKPTKTHAKKHRSAAAARR